MKCCRSVCVLSCAFAMLNACDADPASPSEEDRLADASAPPPRTDAGGGPGGTPGTDAAAATDAARGTDERPSPSPPPEASPCPEPSGDGPHAYYDGLVARADHYRSYSLRDQAQLVAYGHVPRGEDPDIDYIWPDDPDPRRQDAAKLVVPSDGSGIRSTDNRNSIYQVRVPIDVNELGHTYLVTWDAWYGDEWRMEVSGIPAHKAFQLDGPDRLGGRAKIWWEIHHAYKNIRSYPVLPDEVARLAVRHYASSFNASTGIGVPAGPNVTSGSTSMTPTTPYSQWNIRPERWVRHWQLIEYGLDSDPWRTDPPGTLMSLWVADEDRAPVQLYDRLQVTLWPPGIRKLWIEVNTSTNEVKAGRPDLVAYFRNVVVLRDVTYDSVPSLLECPER